MDTIIRSMYVAVLKEGKDIESFRLGGHEFCYCMFKPRYLGAFVGRVK